MGLFSRKKEESLLPDLPEEDSDLPRLPDLPASDSRGMGASDFKGRDMGDVQQNAIKNEIHNQKPNNSDLSRQSMQRSQFEPLPHYDVEGMPAKVVAEPSHFMESRYEADDNFDMPEREVVRRSSVRGATKEARPIYVRLDKFKEGLESFEDIKSKITEIEDLLSKVREMKDREEKELMEWEREIQIIKARIEQIDSDVFGNVE